MGTGENGGFRAVGLTTEFWSTAEPVRKIVREAFTRAGIRPFGPHSSHTCTRGVS